MKSAGIAIVNGQVVVAVLINSSVHIHRVKDVNEAKEILSTAKPDVIGMDESSASIYEDIKYGFNTIKAARLSGQAADEILKDLVMLNIMKESDKPAILAACEALKTTEN